MRKHDSHHYTILTEEELAADEYFQQWVLLPNDDSNKFWLSFIKTYPDQAAKVKSAELLVQRLSGKELPAPSRLSSHEKHFLKSIIYRELGFPDPVAPPEKKNRNNIRKWTVVAAAVLTSALILKFFPIKGNNYTPSQMLSENTRPGQIKEILLPDSSLVILNGASEIRYNPDMAYTPTREVELHGNAYFDVKKTPRRTPFVVYTNDLKIQVTGTEFNVDAHSGATGIVLTSGSVNVSLKSNSSRTAQMTAGQWLKLDTVRHEFVKGKADTGLYTSAWKQKEWHFEETTLETIADLIKEYYGVDVVFQNQAAKQMMMTAVISVEDFQTLISTIEKTLDINIQINNKQLIIH